VRCENALFESEQDIVSWSAVSRENEVRSELLTVMSRSIR